MSSLNIARASELARNLSDVSRAIAYATKLAPRPTLSEPLLVAVSKLKPASDIELCYQSGQRAFGENYVQECVDKARQLPTDIQWHFIGPLQSNKAKQLASIPNLYAFHTLTSTKIASQLSKHLAAGRKEPLRIFIQINTSLEDSKSGIGPISNQNRNSEEAATAIDLCKHVIQNCPGLHLTGLMTIGSITESKTKGENHDFTRLDETRSILENILSSDHKEDAWGEDVEFSSDEGKGRRLLLSMGMSSDFETAIRQGSDVVRVGSDVFGARPPKGTYTRS